MEWLLLEDKDYFLLSNQLMGCVEEIKIRRKKKKKITCVVGNLFWFFIYPLRRKNGDHFQSNMVGGNMERLGKLVGGPCCTWCCIMKNC